MGGWFALRFAIERPERVTALALVTAPALAFSGARVPTVMALASTGVGCRMAASAPPPSARITRRMLAAIGGQGVVRGVPDAMFEALGAATALSGPTNATVGLSHWRTPRPEPQVDGAELAGCPVPVLLLWGDHDRVQSSTAGEWAAGLLPHGRLEVLPGGHGLWFDVPQRCGQLVTEFLDGTERPGI